MPMRSFRLPEDLDARLEESRGGMKRSEWLLEAVREKLSRSVEPAPPMARTVLEIRTAHGAGVPNRADAFRAAAARRQAALKQKP